MNSSMRAVAMLATILSAAQATVTFEHTYGFDGKAYCVEQTRDGGYILTFEGHDSDREVVGKLLKTDSLGNLEWWRQYYSPTHSGAVPNGLCATLDHGYVLAGHVGGSGVSDGWAVKADSVGDTLWTYVLAGPGYDYFVSVTPTPDSGCILAGTLSEGSEDGMALLKLSRDGRREWLKFYCPPGKRTGSGWVWPTGDRGYFCVGGIGGDTSGAWYLVKTDSVGDTLWTAVGGPVVDWEGSACPTAEGGAALCGTRAIGHGCVSYLAKFDSLGHNLWTHEFFLDSGSTPACRMAECVQEAPDRGFIVVGTDYIYPSYVVLAKLDSVGDTLWTRDYDGADSALSDYGYWVVNTLDGGFAVSAYADERSVYLIKTDSMGLVYSGVSERGSSLLRDDMLTAEPNPFRRVVNIRLGPGTGEVFLNGKPCQSPALTVYDAAGRMVRRLPSVGSTTWDGRNDVGQLLPAGTYFVEARTGPQRRVVQVLFAR